MTCIVAANRKVTQQDTALMNIVLAYLKKKQPKEFDRLTQFAKKQENENKVVAVITAMGSDTAGSSNAETSSIIDPKCFQRGPFSIGCTTSFEMIKILRNKFSPPEREPGQNPVVYMETVVSDHIQKLFEDNKFEQTHNGKKEGGIFLIVYMGMVFENQGDYSLIRCKTGKMSVGSGERHAEGGMAMYEFLLKGGHIKELPVEVIVEGALTAGCKNPFVDKPFHMMTQIDTMPEDLDGLKTQSGFPLVYPFSEGQDTGVYTVIH